MNYERLSGSVHGGNVYAAKRNLGVDVKEFLDFSANINPLGVSPIVKEAMIRSLEYVNSYPDIDAYDLVSSIIDTYGGKRSEIVLGNGAVELIFQICRSLKPVRVIVPVPTFLEYSLAAQSLGIVVHNVPIPLSPAATMPVDELARKLRKNDMVFICNPNNPTGSILDREQLLPLLERAKAVGVWIVVDESFIDFRQTHEKETCRPLVGKFENLVVLHSLTKYLAIPGLRLGFLRAVESVTGLFGRNSIPWNVNVVAQAAGATGLRDSGYRQMTVNWLAKERNRFAESLSKIPGFKVFEPSVNFLLVDIQKSGWTADALQEKLWPHHIMVRNCANFIGLTSGYMRLAVRSEVENDRLAGLLHNIVCKEGEK